MPGLNGDPRDKTAGSMQREHPDKPVDDAIPRGLRIGAAFTWRLLVIAAALLGVALAVRGIAGIVIPFLIGIILTALLDPLANFLRRHRWPKWLAILTAMLIGLAVVVGLLLLVTSRVLTTLPDIERQIGTLRDSLDALLARLPFGINPDQINSYLSEVTQWLRDNISRIATRAASVGRHAVHILEGMFIAIIVTLFLMIDGAKVWEWVTRLFPRRAHPRIHAAGRAGWHTLTEFSRIQIVVAAIDAIGIGVGAWLLGVPLATPIAVIVFFGALVPIIGSIVAGVVAVVIALLFNGLTDALIMLGIVLLVNQLEGNVLHPLITGSAVRVHPLGVVLGVITGAAVAGIAGAFFAVPLMATANAMIHAAADFQGDGIRPGVHGDGTGSG
ncbi:MAG TPA: AI-2E family transporter [Oleiagrimonas sp.]|nr:AI-2E family transporter [Oleiagrimonas sp.]